MDFLKELPKEIIGDIIIRAPYKFHNKFKQLREELKDLVQSDYQKRIEIGKSEKFICLLHQAGITMYDPVHGSWHALPPLLPGFKPSYSSRLVWWGTKLVVMGLERDHKDKCVLFYDFRSTSWSEGEEEPAGEREDWQFGYCASAQGIVYFPPSKAYVIAENRWENDPKMPEQDELPSGVSIARMAYLFDPIIPMDNPKVFDPNLRNWVAMENLVAKVVALKYLFMKGVSGTIWATIIYKDLCDRMQWDKIFLYERPKSISNIRHAQKFCMFDAISQRWFDIQMPVESENVQVFSATTIEI